VSLAAALKGTPEVLIICFLNGFPDLISGCKLVGLDAHPKKLSTIKPMNRTLIELALENFVVLSVSMARSPIRIINVIL
jgi:hypothetical protein